MKRNKLYIVVAFVMVCMLSISPLRAIEMYDGKATEDVYKASEDSSNFTLPFARVSAERMVLDKAISQVGFIGCNSTVEIEEPLEKVQVICSNDTVRINADMDYAVICSAGSVMINANVDTLFVFAAKSVVIGEGGNVTGTLAVYTPSLEVNSEIDGNIIGSTDKAKVSAPIGGTLRIETEDIKFDEEVTVENGVQIETYTTGMEIPETVGESVVEVKEYQTEEVAVKTTLKERILKEVSNIMYILVGDIIIYLVFVIATKKEKRKDILEKMTFGNTFVSGIKMFAILLGTMLVSLLLIALVPKVSLAGLILSIGGLSAIAFIEVGIAGIVAANWVEKKFMPENDSLALKYLFVLLTCLVIEILKSVPYVGGIVGLMTFCVALGTIVNLFCKEKNATDATVIEE